MRDPWKIEIYGFNVFGWIKKKLQRKKGWKRLRSVGTDLSDLDKNEEEM